MSCKQTVICSQFFLITIHHAVFVCFRLVDNVSWHIVLFIRPSVWRNEDVFTFNFKYIDCDVV